MKPELFSRIAEIITKESLKKSLEEYFIKKFNSLNEDIYPPMLQDMWTKIPALSNKVEVVPYVEEVNPATGVVKIGWNLFVLGVNRMNLGESQHQSMQDLAQSYAGNVENLPFEAKKTPEDIIEFVITILDNSSDGIELPPSKPVDISRVQNTSGFVTPADMAKPAGASISGKFYGHSGSGYQAGA